MQSAEEFHTRLCSIRGDTEPLTMDDAEQEYKQRVAKRIAAIAARDAEWQARVDKLEMALKNLLYTAEKLWDDAKPIKDSEIVRATHPIIEQARAALEREV